MSIFNIFKKNQQISNKNQDFYSNDQVSLPANFSQMVMQLEMQLQFLETYNLDVIKQLNQLYRIGIQYYINVDDKKAHHFKSKLTSLLTHPNTLDIIQKKPISAKNVNCRPSTYNKNLKQQLGKFSCQSQIVVKTIMQGSQKKIEKHNRLVNQNLTTQQKMLQRRLQQRSRSKSKTKTNLM